MVLEDCIVRLLSHRKLELIAGKQIITELEVNPPQRIRNSRTIGLFLSRHLSPTQSRVQILSFLREEEGEIVAGDFEVWIDLQGLLVILFGILHFPLVF